MKLQLRLSAVFLAGAFYAFAPQAAFAAVSAFDAANDVTYNDGWSSSDNGGYGFTAWQLDGAAGSGTFGRFTSDSRNLTDSTSGGNINVGGKAFGLYANPQNSGAFSGARRDFTGGALTTSQVLSFAIAVNFRNGNKGFDLRDSNGNSIWNFNVGGDAYKQNGNNLANQSYSDNTVFSFAFTQNSSTLSWSITRSGGQTGTDSGTSSIGSGTITGIRFYIAGTDGGNENDFYFNSLQVVPEPTTWALIGFGVMSAGVGVRRWWLRRHA
jgi:hypothetical protein